MRQIFLPLAFVCMGATTFVSSSTFAQQAMTPQTSPMPEAKGTEMDFGMHHFARSSFHHLKPEERAVVVDAHVAALKAGLKLTPEQEKLWPALEAAIREGVKRHAEFLATRGEAHPAQAMDRLERRAQVSTLNGEILTKIVDAARPLYASLTEEQKKRLELLSTSALPKGMRGMHEGMGHASPLQGDTRETKPKTGYYTNGLID